MTATLDQKRRKLHRAIEHTLLVYGIQADLGPMEVLGSLTGMTCAVLAAAPAETRMRITDTLLKEIREIVTKSLN